MEGAGGGPTARSEHSTARAAGSTSSSAARIVVVTGGNKGIGWHIAEQLVKAGGLQVIVACRDPGRGQKAAAELGATFEELDLDSTASIEAFATRMTTEYGGLDILVNNAAIAFKGSDPTPFHLQTGPTLKVNFWATTYLTDLLLPLLRESAARGRGPRLVNVASMAGKLSQVAVPLQQRFSSPTLTRQELAELVRKFEADVAGGRHRQEGWGNSNYGLSKLALIAYTKMVGREEGPCIKVNACCPGWCQTDMSSHSGPRHPADGARNAVILALLGEDGPTGEFWQNERVSHW